MSNKFFEPIDFEAEYPKAKPEPVPEPTGFEKDISGKVLEVEQELALVQAGRSDYVAHAVKFNEKGCPLTNTFKRLRDVPNKENLRRFIKITNQDLGRRHAVLFAEMFEDVDPGVMEALNE